MPRTSGWKVCLIVAGLHDGGIGAYHLVLPYQWDWAAGLKSVPDSLVWGVYMVNFSWGLLALTMGGLIFLAAWQDPATRFVRRVVLAIGLFWAVHGVYLWLHPVPVPDSLLWLKYSLAGFPAVAVALHWLPLWLTREVDDESHPHVM